MALLLLGTAPVLSGTILRPLRGAWTADLEVDADASPSGRLSLTGAGVTLVGTVVHAQSWNDRQRVRLVGGAGGLGKALAAQWFTTPTVATVARSILTGAGETLSGTSDASITGRRLSGWARLAGTAEGLLEELVRVTSPGAIWRTLNDGTIWIGKPTYATVTTTAVELDQRGDEDIADLDGEDMTLDAGVTVLGRKVGLVRHEIGMMGLRTEAWWTSGA